MTKERSLPRAMLGVAVALGLLGAPAASSAATFYVDNDAPTTPPSCTTPAAPCMTISAAVEA